jgi:hypothetical protein
LFCISGFRISRCIASLVRNDSFVELRHSLSKGGIGERVEPLE